MPDGDVGFCREFGFIGNLNSETLENIYNSKKAISIRMQMRRCSYNCTFLTARFHENLFDELLRFKNLLFAKTPHRVSKDEE